MLKISQETMAKALGLSDKSLYSRRENGETEFKNTEIPLLSNTLDIPLEKIFAKTLLKQQ